MNSLTLATRNLCNALASGTTSRTVRPAFGMTVFNQQHRLYSAHAEESDEAFDARWESYFKNDNIDLWELRKGLNDLFSHDLVPSPKILEQAMRAARRLNEHSINVRILEGVKEKADNDEIYRYVVSELKPTMSELGISTPEELGLDK